MQSIEPSIVQSTTVKTIKELKKLGESRIIEQNEQDIDQSTVSGKGTPEEEICKTQQTHHTKITLNKKLSLKPESLRQFQQNKESITSNTTNAYKRPSMRFASQKASKNNTIQQEPVELSNALNLILQKSKSVREQFDQMQLTQTQINKFLKDNKQFHFSYQSMLDKLVTQGKLSSTLTNIPKTILMQIEQFVIVHVRRCIQRIELNQNYQEKQKTIDSLFNKYEKELENYQKNIILF